METQEAVLYHSPKISFRPSYEGWKLQRIDMVSALAELLDLPMRDGNRTQRQGQVVLEHLLDLPMRDGNSFTSAGMSRLSAFRQL